MKISCENDIYNIILEYPETVITIGASDLKECEKKWLEYMAGLFKDNLGNSNLNFTKELMKIME